MTISRRGFISAAGAFAGLGLLPSWLAFRQRRHIDLSLFCGVESLRYTLDKPFAQDGRVYATDARIMVRTLLADTPELGEGAKLPAASTMRWWGEDSRWKPWPRQRLFGGGYDYDCECPVCFGRGCHGNPRKCADCKGEGYRMVLPSDLSVKERAEWSEEELLDACGYDVPCKPCLHSGWLGDVRCDYCDGSGRTYRPSLQRIEGEVIAGVYDAKIRTLGGAEYCLVDGVDCCKSPTQIIKFRGDGFEGLLMPLVRDAWRTP